MWAAVRVSNIPSRSRFPEQSPRAVQTQEPPGKWGSPAAGRAHAAHTASPGQARPGQAPAGQRGSSPRCSCRSFIPFRMTSPDLTPQQSNSTGSQGIRVLPNLPGRCRRGQRQRVPGRQTSAREHRHSRAPALHASENFKVNRWFSFRFGFTPSDKTQTCPQQPHLRAEQRAPASMRKRNILAPIYLLCHVYDAAVDKLAAALRPWALTRGGPGAGAARCPQRGARSARGAVPEAAAEPRGCRAWPL